MRPLSDFQTLLMGLIDHVYFQPPENIKMTYPCIVYNRSAFDIKFANNKIYSGKTRYSVTLIGHDPDSPVIANLLNLPLTSFDRHFTSDNLNHDVFNVYY